MSRRDSRDLARILTEKAAGDAAVLAKLVDDTDVPDDVLGFHAQQAAEKYVKAVLAAREVEFERTHNLAYLLGLLEDGSVGKPPNAEELPELTPWATDFRYESASGRALDRPGALALVRAVRKWAEERLGRSE